MAKRLEPRTEYHEHEGYPAVPGSGVSRRGFLKGALAGTAAAAGVMIAPRVASADKRHKVTVYINNYHVIGGTNMRAQKLVVFTGSKPLAKWLRNHRNTRSLGKRLMKHIHKAKSDTIYDGKKLYRLERKLAQAVAREYRSKTRKMVAAPDVMLQLARSYRRRRCPGSPRPPIRPFP